LQARKDPSLATRGNVSGFKGKCELDAHIFAHDGPR
jgi:hypothetical protein